MVESHIRLSYREKRFTIIGVQLCLFDDIYKVKADHIAGIYEIDLDIYVPTDDLYLDEMEGEGY